MKVLYHGTRYLNSILASQRLRPATIGDKHVSLTTSKYVAKYWANMSRDDVFGFGYIITLDRDLLERDGYSLRPFESAWAQIEEHEVACDKSIVPIGRYVIRIESLPGSYQGLEELARSCPEYVKIHYKKLLEAEEGSWNSRLRKNPHRALGM